MILGNNLLLIRIELFWLENYMHFCTLTYMHFCMTLEKNKIFFIFKTVPEYGFCIFKLSPVEAVFDIEVIIC